MLLRPPKSIRKRKYSTLKSGATGVLSMSYRMFRALTNFNIWHSGVEKAPPDAVGKTVGFQHYSRCCCIWCSAAIWISTERNLCVLWYRHTSRLSGLPSVTLSLLIFILLFSAQIFFFFTVILLPLPLSLSGSLSFCLCVCEPDLLNQSLLKPRLYEWFVFEPQCSW